MPTEKRNVPASDGRKLTTKQELFHLANAGGLDRTVEQWWADNAPDVERGQYHCVDGEEGSTLQHQAYERRRRAQLNWLIDHDYLAGEALREGLRQQASHEQEDRRREQMDREAREDRWYR